MNSGVILGKTGKEIVTDSTNENVLVCGPCRCGKGANTVIPTLKTFQKSVFAIDWHGEASWFSINDRKKWDKMFLLLVQKSLMIYQILHHLTPWKKSIKKPK